MLGFYPGGAVVAGDGRGRRRGGSVVDVLVAPVVPGLEEDDDGVRRDTAKTMAWTACVDLRPGAAAEAAGVRAGAGELRVEDVLVDLAAGKNRTKGIRRCARTRGRRWRPRGGGGDSPCRRKSTKHGGGRAELRRAISAAWRHDSEGEQRGKREEVEGFYRGGLGEANGGLNRRGIKGGESTGRNCRGWRLKTMTSA